MDGRSTMNIISLFFFLISTQAQLFRKVESGRLDGSSRVAARFVGAPILLRRSTRMIERDFLPEEEETQEKVRALGSRNIYYYGDNQQLSRASGRFHSKMHAFPTHSIPFNQPQQDETSMIAPPVYDPKRHHRDKLNEDTQLIAEAGMMARNLERTTMKVKLFTDIDIKMTTPVPKKSQPSPSIPLRVSPSPPSSPPKIFFNPPPPFSRPSPSQIILQPPPIPNLPLHSPLQSPPQVPPVRVHPQQVQSSLSIPPAGAFILPPNSQPPLVPPPPPPLPPQATFIATLPPPPNPPPSPFIQTPPPVINSQAANTSLEQLGCGWDIISNSCKDVFAIGWCGQCYDFGNIFVHDCKCVLPLINVSALIPPRI